MLWSRGGVSLRGRRGPVDFILTNVLGFFFLLFQLV